MGKRDSYQIFSEAGMAGMKLKNRLVRSATYEAAMTKNGRVTDKILNLYQNLARGGVGLIITGHMAVSAQGKAAARQICLYDDRFIKEIQPIADTVHRSGEGCKIVAQLSHAGRQVLYDNRDAEAIGPSEVPSPVLKKRARALTIEEIEVLVQSFAEAVVRARKAGFDGVQIHAAHGWLISSFLSPYTNRRKDDYGGSVSNRVKILREIVSAARKKVGSFPILAKINCDDHVPGGIHPEEFRLLIREVEKTGLDAVEISGGMWDCLARSREELGFPPVPIPESRTQIAHPDRQSYYLNSVKNLNLSIPLILVGGNRNIESMEKIIREGAVSFLALARPLINEPDLPRRWLEGQGKETANCVSCNACLVMVKQFSLCCLLNENKTMQKVVRRMMPLGWKLFFR